MEIWIHHKCEGQINEIKRTSPKLYKIISQELKDIAHHDNPEFYPRIKKMRGCAAGWYRLAIYQPLSVRIIFRFLIRAQTNQWYEIQCSHRLWDDGKRQKILQVVKIGFRCSVYDKLDRYVRMIK